MSGTIVFLDPLAPSRMAQLRDLAPAEFMVTVAASREEADQIAAIAAADYAISGDVPVTRPMLRAASSLKGLHKWGVGIDNFDLVTARERGVIVMRTTGSNAIPVAESSVGLMLTLQRAIVAGDRGLRAGSWLKSELGPQIFMLSGKTVGLVGLGAIGSAVARLLQGFRCEILYAKPAPVDAATEAALGVIHVPLDELLARSDIVSLHCPLTVATSRLIDATALASMKDSALLINTARGGIVVEDELAAALRNGVIRGAAIDVFEVEPVPADNPLLHLPNAIVTPHCASQAADNFARTVTRMFDNIASLNEGRPVPAQDLVV